MEFWTSFWTSASADIQANWHYLLMPLIAGFVGYITKLLALEMMFRPIEFMGIKPPYLGWQGVVPRKAPKMASTATDLLMGRIFQLEELMARLDPKRMIKEVEGPLNRAVDELVNEIGDRFMGVFWTTTPDLIKRRVIRHVQKSIPDIAGEVWSEISREPQKYIDIKHLLIENLVRDKVLLNDIFRRIGHKEFVFFRSAGFWFGCALGFVQLLCWLIWHEPMLIPMFGGIVGLLTDWAALQLLFRPLNPIYFMGMKIQGKFIARQKEVARDYAALIAKQLLTPANMIEEILRGPCAENVTNLIRDRITQSMDEQFGRARPVVRYALGKEKYDNIHEFVAERVLESIPESSRHIEKFALDAMDINNTIVSRMDLLTPEEFEGMLRPAFKEDEKTLIIAGAVLGFLVGELQVHLML
ncbi:conserved hypothetical protein [gamma proteobacterium HdN1]|nr:conserved hypothetical protein [gamma proteobacterium HdN1]